MRLDGSVLPAGVAALVHHVELNRSGWWDKVVQRLTLAAVWSHTSPPTVQEVNEVLISQFKLRLPQQKLAAALSALERQGSLVVLPTKGLRIPDAQRDAFEKEIAQAEDVEDRAREFFCELARVHCPGVEPEAGWALFQEHLLTPLIEGVGANAYHLITGEPLQVDQTLVEVFLGRFAEATHSGLREVVTLFLDPKKEGVRAYVSRMLHARFCVEASGLSEPAIEKLRAALGGPAQFRVFLDTNFLFSLLELHENPSNSAARDLLDLVTRLKSNPSVKLFVLPRTIVEAQASISSAKQRLLAIPPTNNFTQAALSTGLSGMAEKFFLERQSRAGRLTAEDWFDPYLEDFVAILRGKGVELFNETLDSYAKRQDVIDDILAVMESEKLKYQENRRKSYQKVAHDMVLWHFVKDQRPGYVESPMAARDWILTVDFRLIGFDDYQRKASNLRVPICLHPSSLVQLLQFWVPRTKEFEEAMLGSLRLPFLFQAFDVEAERTSLRILEGLGRFEGRDDISAEALTNVILNQDLRARLQTAAGEDGANEIALVRDALVEEMRIRIAAEAARAQQLSDLINQKDVAIGELDAGKRLRDEEVGRLSAKVEEEASRGRQTASELAVHQAEVERLKTSLKQIEQSKARTTAMLQYAGLLFVVLLFAGAAGWQADALFPGWQQFIGGFPTRATAGVLVFIAGHLLLEVFITKKGGFEGLWPLEKARSLRSFLWSIVILGLVVGVLGNLLSNRIQRRLDEAERPASPEPARSSASREPKP